MLLSARGSRENWRKARWHRSLYTHSLLPRSVLFPTYQISHGLKICNVIICKSLASRTWMRISDENPRFSVTDRVGLQFNIHHWAVPCRHLRPIRSIKSFGFMNKLNLYMYLHNNIFDPWEIDTTFSHQNLFSLLPQEVIFHLLLSPALGLGHEYPDVEHRDGGERPAEEVGTRWSDCLKTAKI